MDSGDSVGDLGDTCACLNSTNICVGAIKQTVKTSVTVNGRRTAVSVDSRILVLVIVEPDSLSLGACEYWAL